MKTYSIQRTGFRNIKATSPQEAAEKFAERVAKKKGHMIRRSPTFTIDLLITPGDAEKFAVIYYDEDPCVGQHVVLMWDVTSWTFCK